MNSDIYSMNLKELYNLLMTHDNEIKELYKEEIETIKSGKELKIPLIYIINDWYTPYPITGKVGILGIGKTPINEFYEEIQTRENIIRQIIIEIEDDDVTTGR